MSLYSSLVTIYVLVFLFGLSRKFGARKSHLMMMSTYNNQLSKQAVWDKVYLWLNISTVLWFIRAISFVNETPHWLHLKPDEVSWKESEGKGCNTKQVCNVHSDDGRTFHAGLRGKLLIICSSWQSMFNCKAKKRIFGELKKNMPSIYIYDPK